MVESLSSELLLKERTVHLGRDSHTRLRGKEDAGGIGALARIIHPEKD
jgi:hypothetical protein